MNIEVHVVEVDTADRLNIATRSLPSDNFLTHIALDSRTTVKFSGP